jgi:hypothetical protein
MFQLREQFLKPRAISSRWLRLARLIRRAAQVYSVLVNVYEPTPDDDKKLRPRRNNLFLAE